MSGHPQRNPALGHGAFEVRAQLLTADSPPRRERPRDPNHGCAAENVIHKLICTPQVTEPDIELALGDEKQNHRQESDYAGHQGGLVPPWILLENTRRRHREADQGDIGKGIGDRPGRA